MATTGIVLSGGKSIRMGKEKGLSLLSGKPLIEYSIKALSPVCQNIIIGANNSNYDYLGYPVVKDIHTDIGPAAGIYSCLKASTTSDNIVLSCDIPLVSSRLIQYILSQKKDYHSVIPYHDMLPEPMCAYYNQQIVPTLENAIENGIYKIQLLIKEVDYYFLEIDKNKAWYHDRLFANINTPEDLSAIENYLDKRKIN